MRIQPIDSFKIGSLRGIGLLMTLAVISLMLIACGPASEVVVKKRLETKPVVGVVYGGGNLVLSNTFCEGPGGGGEKPKYPTPEAFKAVAPFVATKMQEGFPDLKITFHEPKFDERKFPMIDSSSFPPKISNVTVKIPTTEHVKDPVKVYVYADGEYQCQDNVYTFEMKVWVDFYNNLENGRQEHLGSFTIAKIYKKGIGSYTKKIKELADQYPPDEAMLQEMAEKIPAGTATVVQKILLAKEQ